tara:strand:- start:183 stop:884 length:702 start_codon:yes stop_codon:yes gene_type:complete
MKKVIIPILMVCLSFAQFEAGKKMVSGKVADFKTQMYTWDTSSSLNVYAHNYLFDYDEVTLADTEMMINATGSYFLIDNFALSFGLSYTLNNKTWLCDGSDCNDWFFTDMTASSSVAAPEALSPFGFMLGGQYHMGDAYGFGSFSDPSSEAEDDAYLSIGGGYMYELASGIYLDTRVEYRMMMSGGDDEDSEPIALPSEVVPYGSYAQAALNSPYTSATQTPLTGTVGITVVF